MAMKEKLRSFLGMEARIEIKDGRVFYGTFMCVDKQRNVILQHVSEWKAVDGKMEMRRNISLITVPGEHIVSFGIERTAMGEEEEEDVVVQTQLGDQENSQKQQQKPKHSSDNSEHSDDTPQNVHDGNRNKSKMIAE
eukprot:m.109434 g.109434  ORF g.109434 m.109434 type:complete len:137 (-) comp12732_c0_seq1:8300-8710(-)